LETISSFSKNDYINRKLAPKQFDRHNFLWRMATFQPNVRWAEPSPCHSGSGEQDGIESVLTNEQVDSWRNRGFALVNGVIPEDLLVAVKADAAAMFPPPGSQEAEKLRDFGSGGRMDFPCPESDAFNRVIVHHRLLKCLSQLLDVDVMDLRLTQGELWPKYGSERSGVADDNTDQRMHCDYPNHTLAHPSEWENPEAVEMILYLNNVEECGGATAVVPREGPEDKGYQWPICQMPGFGSLVWHNDMTLAEQYLRESSPEVAQFRAQHLYPRESYAKFQFGTILLNPLYSGTDSISKRGYMPIRDTIEADEETPLSSSFSKSRDKNGRTVEYISIDNSAEEKQERENLAVVPAQSDFQGDRYQGQIMKFERILAHLVNERTVLAWFRTNLAFVILGLKYLKLGNVYLDSEHFASILLFICGGVFLAILPFSWYSGYYRYEKCKEMIDYNIDQLGNFLYKLGFDFDNMSLAFIIFSSFFGIIISSTMIIWTTTTSDDYSPI
jgi:hypothetical protein